jgi:hypothetical protein
VCNASCKAPNFIVRLILWQSLQERLAASTTCHRIEHTIPCIKIHINSLLLIDVIQIPQHSQIRHFHPFCNDGSREKTSPAKCTVYGIQYVSTCEILGSHGDIKMAVF